ncbi:UNVERIFIED_CONTAM: hypothetical protein FKN15_071785 [Acipenser sinensis]
MRIPRLTACDQVLEQTCNCDCKMAGGITGVTLNYSAVNRWILSQSERAAIAHGYKRMAGLHDSKRSRKDLDQTVWNRDERAVKSIIECIDEMCNLFSHANSELLSISSGVVAMASVSRDLQDARDRGDSAFE